MKKKYKKTILTIALVCIFIFQTLPISVGSDVNGLDKIVHFVIYFFLTFLFFWNKFSLLKSVVFSIFYGIFMEMVQFITPGRELSVYDFFTNCLGTFSFLIILKLYMFYKKNG